MDNETNHEDLAWTDPELIDLKMSVHDAELGVGTTVDFTGSSS